MQQTVLFHCSAHGLFDDSNSVLCQSDCHAFVAVVIIVGMLFKYLMYFDQKKLTFRRFFAILQPPAISGFAHLEQCTHAFYCVLAAVLVYEQVSFFCLYFFRSFAKKARASFV